jgi:hypothetical protein
MRIFAPFRYDNSSSEQYRLELYEELESFGQIAPDTNGDDVDYYYMIVMMRRTKIRKARKQ